MWEALAFREVHDDGCDHSPAHRRRDMVSGALVSLDEVGAHKRHALHRALPIGGLVPNALFGDERLEEYGELFAMAAACIATTTDPTLQGDLFA